MAGHFGKHKELTTSLDSLQRIGYLWDVFLPQTFGNAKLPSAGSNWSPQREVFESLEDQPGSRTGMYNSYHHIEWINHHKFTHVYRGYMCHMYIPFFSYNSMGMLGLSICLLIMCSAVQAAYTKALKQMLPDI